MKLDKRIEQFIAHGYKEIDLTKEEYESLKPQTKNLIKLNNIKVNIIKNWGGTDDKRGFKKI